MMREVNRFWSDSDSNLRPVAKRAMLLTTRLESGFTASTTSLTRLCSHRVIGGSRRSRDGVGTRGCDTPSGYWHQVPAPVPAPVPDQYRFRYRYRCGARRDANGSHRRAGELHAMCATVHGSGAVGQYTKSHACSGRGLTNCAERRRAGARRRDARRRRDEMHGGAEEMRRGTEGMRGGACHLPRKSRGGTEAYTRSGRGQSAEADRLTLLTVRRRCAEANEMRRGAKEERGGAEEMRRVRKECTIFGQRPIGVPYFAEEVRRGLRRDGGITRSGRGRDGVPY